LFKFNLMGCKKIFFLIGVIFVLFLVGNVSAEYNVSIYRDIYGVPHIRSNSLQGLYYGAGYAMAQDKIKTISLGVHKGRGDSARVPVLGNIGWDIKARLMETKEDSEKQYTHLGSEGKIMLDSFSDGLNKYIAENKNTLPAWVENISSVDLMTIEHQPDLLTSHYEAIQRLEYAFGRQLNFNEYIPPLSNMFVVDKTKTEGTVMGYGEPHLPVGTESYLIHLTLDGSGGFDVYGFTLVGFPSIGPGFTEDLFWSGTNNGPNFFEIYEETIRPNDASYNQYLYDGTWRDITIKKKNISYWDANSGTYKTNEYTFKYTHHGPIIYTEGNYGKAYTLKTTASDIAGVDIFSFFKEMYSSGNVDVIKESLNDLPQMRSNLLAADKQGNILYLSYARYPKRDRTFENSDPDFFLKPIPGNTSATEWQGIHPLSDIPQLENPSTGFLQNCNDHPGYVTTYNGAEPYITRANTNNAPYYILKKDLIVGARGRVALTLLSKDNDITFQDFRAYTKDSKPYDAISLGDFPDLGSHTGFLDALLYSYDNNPGLPQYTLEYNESINMLRNWDRKLSKDSREATLYTFFEKNLKENVPGINHNFTLEQLPQNIQYLGLQSLNDSIVELKSIYGITSIQNIPKWGDINVFEISGFDNGNNIVKQQYNMGLGSSLHSMFGEFNNGDKKFHKTGGISSYLVVELKEPSPEAYVMKPVSQTENSNSAQYGTMPERFSNDIESKAFFTLSEITANLDTSISPNPLELSFGDNESNESTNNVTENDTISPVVIITSPENNKNYSLVVNKLIFNASDDVGLQKCWYSTDKGRYNITTSCTLSISLNSVEGKNNWSVYAQDTSGNIGSDSVTFYVQTSPSVDTKPGVIGSIINFVKTPVITGIVIVGVLSVVMLWLIKRFKNKYEKTS